MFETTVGEGRHRISLTLIDTGRGWIGSLVGGESPHVGGVVLAWPLDSQDADAPGCELRELHLPGHLDHQAALPMARQLCQRLHTAISITAGIHVEQADAEDIRVLLHLF